MVDLLPAQEADMNEVRLAAIEAAISDPRSVAELVQDATVLLAEVRRLHDGIRERGHDELCIGSDDCSCVMSLLPKKNSDG